MRKAKDLIGKEIVNQGTGERLAMVQDVILDRDARQAIALLIDSGGWFRDAKVVHWSNVVSVGDVIVVRGETPVVIASDDPQIALLMEEKASLDGTAIISNSGERIGAVGDLFIDDSGRVLGYEVSQGFISDLSGRKFLPVEHIKAVGKDAIIADPSDLPLVKEVLHPGKEESQEPLPEEPPAQQHATPRGG